MHSGRGKPVYDGGNPNQENEGRTPRGIENVTRDEQVKLLRFPGKGQVEQYEHDGKEEEECDRVEQHLMRLRVALARLYQRLLGDILQDERRGLNWIEYGRLPSLKIERPTRTAFKFYMHSKRIETARGVR